MKSFATDAMAMVLLLPLDTIAPDARSLITAVSVAPALLAWVVAAVVRSGSVAKEVGLSTSKTGGVSAGASPRPAPEWPDRYARMPHTQRSTRSLR